MEQKRHEKRLNGKWGESIIRCLLFLMCLAGVFSSVGCSTTPSHIGKSRYVYEYAAQVLAMPSCRATVELVSPCQRRFRTERGRVFIIGSPGAAREVGSFLGSLEEGKSYDLPKAFMDFQRAQHKEPNKTD
jgi:hypothetical protein